MKNIVVSSLILSLLLLSACTSTEQVVNQNIPEREKIKIGVSLALTGDAAHLGEGAKNGLELAKNTLPELLQYDYELIYEDDQLNPKLATNTATKLLDVDNVDVLISFSSGTGNVISSLANEREVLHFGIASDPKVREGPYNFVHLTPPEEEVKAWVAEAKRREYKSLALVSVQNEASFSFLELFRQALEEADVDLVAEELFNPGEKDFSTIVTKVMEEDPDVYFVFAFSPEIESLYKKMQELGVEKPISTSSAFELSPDPSLFDGQWYTHTAEGTDDFIKRYEEAYGVPPSIGSGNLYDILNLMVRAYEETKASEEKPSTEAVANYFLELNGYPGAMGSLNVQEDGLIASPAIVKEIKNGKPTRV